MPLHANLRSSPEVSMTCVVPGEIRINAGLYFLVLVTGYRESEVVKGEGWSEKTPANKQT